MGKTTNKDTESIDLIAMQKQIEALTMALGIVNKANISEDERDITFVSLSISPLNLSTEGYGKGDIYTFNSFGEEQAIPESHAKLLVRKNVNFIKAGLVYIEDEDFVAKSKLKTDYAKILNKNEMLDLFNKSRNEFEKTYTRITSEQKQTFASLVADKMLNGQEVDMNIVKVINNELNINIDEEVENVKKLQNNEE